jgi:uncharacterized protein (TIGR01777 family)
VPLLTGGGHDVCPAVRDRERAQGGAAYWNPAAGEIDAEAFEGLDAVVHLAGENIGEGRWTAEKKRRIRDSRVEGTRLLCDAIGRLSNPPKTLVCASAIGYYGDRGETELDEAAAPGVGFLPDTCAEWEEVSRAVAVRGVRVVNVRFGVILTPRGGALKKMLTPFKMGGGGILGDGRQYMSWVSIDDAVGAIYHALMTDALSGPVNVTSPNPVTNYEFTKTLGRVLRRPTIVPMPRFAVRLAFGEMGDALLLASARVLPERLIETGYEFRHAELEVALRHVLGR